MKIWLRVVFVLLGVLINWPNAQACPSTDKCNCKADQIRCFDFSSFDELQFPAEPTQINILELKPSRRLLIDEHLKLNGLRVAKQVILHNITGFLIQTNPFASIVADSVAEQRAKTGVGLELAMFDSDFEFFESENVKLISMCSRDYFQLFDNSILAKFSKISFNGNIRYSQNLCPFVFKNAKIDLLLAYFMTPSNQLIFQQVDNLDDIGSHVNSLYLFNTNLTILDRRLLSKGVFGTLKTLHYEGTLELVESNLLGQFKGKLEFNY